VSDTPDDCLIVIRLSVEEAEQELRIAAFKREQQRLELEKIKATERMTEQMV
jgi:hypothetical protein